MSEKRYGDAEITQTLCYVANADERIDQIHKLKWMVTQLQAERDGARAEAADLAQICAELEKERDEARRLAKELHGDQSKYWIETHPLPWEQEEK